MVKFAACLAASVVFILISVAPWCHYVVEFFIDFLVTLLPAGVRKIQLGCTFWCLRFAFANFRRGLVTLRRATYYVLWFIEFFVQAPCLTLR